LVRQGIFWLFANSKLHGGWFAVNAIRNLETYFSTYPGLNELIKLKHNYNYAATINGVSIYLITKDLLPNDGRERPMLAVHPTKELLNEL
jgi:hypothetical protein